MAYVDLTGFEQRLGAGLYARLTDRDAGVTADPGVAQQILDEAEAVASSYLSVRYRTPVDLSAHPELAELLAARVLDLAECIAWKTSPFIGDLPERLRFA